MSIDKNRNNLAFVVWEVFEKKLRGVSRNFDFFVFSAAVFPSTAAPQNNLTVLKC